MESAESPNEVDVAIITPIKEEREAMESIFKEYGTMINAFNLKSTGSLSNQVYYSGRVDGCSVICAQCTDKGNLSSEALTSNIISNFRPKYIFVVGIAGGVADKGDIKVGDIKVGDVVFSNSITYYQYGKETESGKPKKVYPIIPPSAILRNMARNVKEWRNRIKTPRPDGNGWEVSKVKEGLILSGETIWDNPESEELKQILEENKDALAFETEAGGVARMIYENAKFDYTPQYIVVRGISDLVNKAGGEKTRKAWRRPVAEAAAAFAYELIRILAQSEAIKLDPRFLSYLNFVMGDFVNKIDIDGKSLQDYYVEPKALLVNKKTWGSRDSEVEDKILQDYYSKLKALLVNKKTWGSRDSEVEDKILQDYYSKLKALLANKEWKVNDFLGSTENWYIVIGASFGMGKTTFAKHLAWELARKCAENPYDPKNYVPIVVRLNGLDKITSYNVFYQENIDTMLNIIAGNNRSKKILLILDGLDEFTGEVSDLLNDVRRYHAHYPNMKVIMLTRLRTDILSSLGVEEYVRLMPFSKEKVNEFFQKYGVELNYEKCEELGLDEEEITKPLFCWTLAMMQANERYKLEFKPEWSKNVKKSLFYYAFVHSIVRGKYRFKEEEEFKEIYPIEKELLRITAALKNLYGDDLTEELLNNSLKNFFEKDYENRAKPLLDLFLTSYFYRSPQKIVSKKIEFIHKSFEEYLLAEYYYESIRDGIRDGKMYRLNAGEPSIETMEFLNGLIGILKDKEAKEFLRKIIDENPLIKDEDRQKIIENSRRIVESEAIIIKAGEEEKEEIWKEVRISSDELWLYRWIALSVFAWLHENETIDKHKIESLIRLSSHFIPSHVKNLERIDLTEANLEEANLSRANLEGANLSRAKLFEANLEGANLSRANLSRADLFEANLSKANLEKANLSRANLMGAKLFEANLSRAFLQRAHLEGANLAEANLSGAYFSEANLIGANLTDVNLSDVYLQRAHLEGLNLAEANLAEAYLFEAHLSGANLSKANLSRAVLLGADLARANLSRANLSRADLMGANLEKANLSEANLTEANLSRANLEGANLSKANLSEAGLSKANLSRAKLTDANLSDVYLSGANISGANLSEARFLEANLIEEIINGARKRVIEYKYAEKQLVDEVEDEMKSGKINKEKQNRLKGKMNDALGKICEVIAEVELNKRKEEISEHLGVPPEWLFIKPLGGSGRVDFEIYQDSDKGTLLAIVEMKTDTCNKIILKTTSERIEHPECFMEEDYKNLEQGIEITISVCDVEELLQPGKNYEFKMNYFKNPYKK
jgi:uncharacterized protein YjbI with pentapeptide repeats/nucleoside phosphorylase